MNRRTLIICCFVFLSTDLAAQTLELPPGPEPTVKKPPKVKVHKARTYGRGMGLFDFSMAGGLINKATHETFTTTAPPADLTTTGNFAMVHMQEGVLSNYFLAKKYHRDKKVKIGFTETLDIGWKGGAATETASDYTTSYGANAGEKSDFFVNYQAGFAAVVRVAPTFDLGATWYFYVNSVFSPDTKSYWNSRLRYRQLMVEASLLGKTSYDFKYLLRNKTYLGFTYTKTNRNFNDGYVGHSAVTTEWYQLSLGKTF
jgi:hypothetical protein